MSTTHTKTNKFKVDDVVLESEVTTLTGAQIKQLAGISPAYQLFLEDPGERHQDRQIQDADTVDLSHPGIEKLYSVPPATFGLV